LTQVTSKLFPSLQGYGGRAEALRKVPHYCNDLSYGEKLACILAVLVLESPFGVLDELGVNSVKGYPVRAKVEMLVNGWDNYLSSIPTTDYQYHKFSQKVEMNMFSKVLFAVSGNEVGEKFTDTVDRLGIRYVPVSPYIQGRDLLSLGMKPSKELGTMLADLYEQQLQGKSRMFVGDLAKQLVNTYLGEA